MTQWGNKYHNRSFQICNSNSSNHCSISNNTHNNNNNNSYLLLLLVLVILSSSWGINHLILLLVHHLDRRIWFSKETNKSHRRSQLIILFHKRITITTMVSLDRNDNSSSSCHSNNSSSSNSIHTTHRVLTISHNYRSNNNNNNSNSNNVHSFLLVYRPTTIATWINSLQGMTSRSRWFHSSGKNKVGVIIRKEKASLLLMKEPSNWSQLITLENEGIIERIIRITKIRNNNSKKNSPNSIKSLNRHTINNYLLQQE